MPDLSTGSPPRRPSWSRVCTPPSIALVPLFFNDAATTEIYTLSLHDALPIFGQARRGQRLDEMDLERALTRRVNRSEEHTSELQSLTNLVCRLLLEKKNTTREYLYGPILSQARWWPPARSDE